MPNTTFATGEVVIQVSTTKFASSLAKARSMFVKTLKGLGSLGAKGGATAFSGLRNAVSSAAKAFGGLLSTVGRLLGPFSAILSLGGVMGVFSGSAIVFAKFEQMMARVHAVTGATTKQFAALSGQARRLGATTAFSASQAAEAMGNFGVAGFKTNEIMAAMKPTLALAAAGQLDMGTSSDIVAKIMRGMGLDAEQTTHAVDVMAKAFTTSNTDLTMLGDAFKYVGPVGKSAGKSLEELAASIQVMSNAGIQGGMAGAALRNVLLRLQSQPSEVKKALDSLGVSIADQFGRMKPLATIIDELNGAMAGKTEMERNAIVTTLASTRASAAFLELLNAGGSTLRQYQKNLEGSAGTAQRIADIQLNTLSGSFTLLKSAMEGAAIAIGEQMAPGLRMIAEAATAIAPTVGKVLSNVKVLAETLGTTVAEKIYAMNDALKQSEGIFKNIFDFMSIMVSNPLGAIKIAGMELGAVGLEWGASIEEGGAKVAAGLGKALGSAWDTLANVLASAWDVMKATLAYGAALLRVAIEKGLSAGYLVSQSAADALNKADNRRIASVTKAKQRSGEAVGSFIGGVSSLAIGDPASTRKAAANLRKQAAQEWDLQIAARDAKNNEFRQKKAIAGMIKSGTDFASTTAGKRAGLAANLGMGLLSGGLVGGLLSAGTAATGGEGKALLDKVVGLLPGAAKVAGKPAGGGGASKGKGGNVTDINSFIASMQKSVLGKGEKAQQKMAENTEKANKLTEKKAIPLWNRMVTGIEAMAGGTAAVFAGEG